jgi:coenzyme F420-0:L-glutamate ligase / coenzyme F420-1:gamma-L-glutamate ligase
VRLEVFGIAGLPEVAAGDDLAALIADALATDATELRDGDVVVVAQKVVSKAEGAIVPLSPGEDVAAARRRLAVQQARRVVVDAPFTVVVETAHGLVCAHGGIDASNVPEGFLLLLPADPDASARRIRAGLLERTGATVAVLVSDTFGRAWRMGQTDVAIGVAGIGPIRDERGMTDREGRVLDVTEAAIADELAGAADLVRRKGDGLPVVVVRGLRYDVDESAGAALLVRPSEQDLFRRGRGALADALAVRTPQLGAPSGRPPRAGVERALAAARGVAGEGCVVQLLDPLDGAADRPVRVAFGSVPAASGGAVLAGVAAGAFVAALLDLDLVATLQGVDGSVADGEPRDAVVVVVGRDEGARRGPDDTPS